MTVLETICDYLEQIAPPHLAEDWDNVGLLVGDGGREIRRIMTCLTVTPETVHEAVEEEVDLIVTHHPMPFRPVHRLTTRTTVGRLLWELTGARISIYSPHTCWDSSRTGINQQLAEGLGLESIEPLEIPDLERPDEGKGRWGVLEQPVPLAALITRTCQFLSVPGFHYVGDPTRVVARVAVACGSAGEFLQTAHRCGCDVLVTGETSFHTSLEAAAIDVALLLPGHYASERFSVETLARLLQHQFPAVQVWASRCERDPLNWASAESPT
jgi:dinuclear metal center YbgI/SA1388 family protein